MQDFSEKLCVACQKYYKYFTNLVKLLFNAHSPKYIFSSQAKIYSTNRTQIKSERRKKNLSRPGHVFDSLKKKW